MMEIHVLDHGAVRLRNIAGPTRRLDTEFDAADTDPANAARFSFDAADRDRAMEQDLRLADYLMRNGHTTPFEMIEVWLEMDLPIFVARQFVRHRTVSINEVSARYTILPEKWYLPRPEHVGRQKSDNKQGRLVDGAINEAAQTFIGSLDRNCRQAYTDYLAAVDAGIPAEIARLQLHVNHYTRWLWHQDLHNLMHFLALRQHSHAQFEARAYADAVYELIRGALPHLMDIYDRYRRKAE